MEERVFLEREGIKVTSARCVVGDKTFAMSNIASVSTIKTYPKLPGITLLVGLAMLLMQPIIGVLVLVAAAVLMWKLKPTHYLMVRTSAGGSSVWLTSKRLQDFEPIINAINEAIVHRG